MADYNIGDKVIKIDSGEHGTVIEVMPLRRGRQLYQVVFPTGEERVLEADLRADFNISDPFARCKGGMFGSYADYAKKNTTFKISNSNNSTISSLKASKTLFRAYQFKPLLKFLNSPTRRLLVADEVGLGKTIEAGHIMLELKARGELKNVLIVCPKSLQVKWKEELYEKFGLAFKIVEHSSDLIADLQSRSGMVRAIINYEKMRPSRRGKNETRTNKDGKYTNFVDYLTDVPQQFSLVLCDEAHKMRNRETQTYKGAEMVMQRAAAGLFLTATPVMISEENLYNLLHLLDGSRYFNYDVFRNRLAENRPFVMAINQLNNFVSLATIKEGLEDAVIRASYTSDEREIGSREYTLADIYGDDPIYQEIMQLLDGTDTDKTRARLQYLFATMSVMSTIFSRTRKREVTTDLSQAERKPHICKVVLHPDEQEDYNAIINNYIESNEREDGWGEEGLSQGGALGLVQKKRMIASSVWGYLNTEGDLDRGIDVYEDLPDAKVEMLLKIIKEVFDSGVHKLVIFAVFRRTLKYLQLRLRKAGYESLIIHGQVGNRAEILNRFKHDNKVQLLLSSEVGSEGLDMQFCNSMVNYDLPWNPMVVEQRIGRIDRFGQQSDVVNIYNIVVSGSIQEDIYMRLLDRIGIFRGTIGDMEAILDAPSPSDGKLTIQDVYNNMEHEFFTKHLTQEERERKIAEVERAIENEKENLQHLEEGLSNSLTNDAYFRDEINRIKNNNAYVTDIELKNYLESAIRMYLTTCRLETVSDNVMEFILPASQPTVLKQFITQYRSGDDESLINANQFKNRIDEEKSFKLTFNQDAAYDDSSLNYLNIYHPLIQSCLNYFLANDDKNMTTFTFALKEDATLKAGMRFYLGLYELASQREIQGVMKRTAELRPLLFDINNDKLVTNQDLVDLVYRRAQVEGMEHNASNEDTSEELIENMSVDFADHIGSVKRSKIDEVSRQMESDHRRNIQQTEEYYNFRIKNYEKTIKDNEDILSFSGIDDVERRQREGAIRLARLGVQNMEREKQECLAQIQEEKPLQLTDKLLSLNLITII